MKLNRTPEDKTLTIEEVCEIMKSHKHGIATLTYYSTPVKGLVKVSKAQYLVKINPTHRQSYVAPTTTRPTTNEYYVVPKAIKYNTKTRKHSLILCPFKSRNKTVSRYFYNGVEIPEETAKLYYTEYPQPTVVKKINAEQIFEIK